MARCAELRILEKEKSTSIHPNQNPKATEAGICGHRIIGPSGFDENLRGQVFWINYKLKWNLYWMMLPEKIRRFDSV